MWLQKGFACESRGLYCLLMSSVGIGSKVSQTCAHFDFPEAESLVLSAHACQSLLQCLVACDGNALLKVKPEASQECFCVCIEHENKANNVHP